MLAAGPPTVVTWGAVIVAGITFAGTLIASLLAYRRGQQADEAATSTKTLELVVSGHTSLVKELQDEVRRIREDRDSCEAKLGEFEARLNEQRGLIDEQRRTIARHERTLDDWIRRREERK